MKRFISRIPLWVIFVTMSSMSIVGAIAALVTGHKPDGIACIFMAILAGLCSTDQLVTIRSVMKRRAKVREAIRNQIAQYN